ELARAGAVFAPLQEELAVAAEHLNAAIGLVGDVDPAVFAEGDAAGHVELALAGAGLSPLAQELACRILDGHLVGLAFFVLLGDAEMADVEIAGLIDRNGTWVRLDRGNGE